MRLFPPPFEVDLVEGFSPEKDLFGRAPIAEGLTRLLENVDQPLVLALDGEWGSGKTTFLRFWAGELKKAKFPVVFFDSFQNDYADDAFLALAGEVFALIESEKSGASKVAKKFASKAIGAGKVLLRSSLKIGVKAATLGAISSTDFEDLADSVSDTSSEVFDSQIGELITQQSANRAAIDEFKDALSKLPSLISPAVGDETQRPLIFIIDELDRCRPKFALELLERIKHFFSVENVHFVLGVNSSQLCSSVKSVYGSDIDAKTYLQKFIHISWTLSQRERYASDRSRAKYARHINAQLGFEGKDLEVARETTAFVAAVAEQKGLSFRTIERVMAIVALSVATTPENHLRMPPLIGGLAIMKVVEPEMFVRAKVGRVRYQEVESFLGLKTLTDDQGNSWDWAIRWWQFATDPDMPKDEVDSFSRGLFQYNIRNRLDLLSHTADVVMDNVTLRPLA